MSTLRIPCPKCHKELKLRDPRLLGKKGKCPKCRHSFLLQMPKLEPEEDEIAGPPKPEDYKPLPEQIQVQEHKVDDFENGAKELELEVRSKKVKDKVKNF